MLPAPEAADSTLVIVTRGETERVWCEACQFLLYEPYNSCVFLQPSANLACIAEHCYNGYVYVTMPRGHEVSRRMTVVFHDEELYAHLKVEAARRHTAASEIIADAVRQWLQNREDADLLPVIESARTEWQKKGGRSWSEVEQEMEEAVSRRGKGSCDCAS